MVINYWRGWSTKPAHAIIREWTGKLAKTTGMKKAQPSEDEPGLLVLKSNGGRINWLYIQSHVVADAVLTRAASNDCPTPVTLEP